MVLVDAVGG